MTHPDDIAQRLAALERELQEAKAKLEAREALLRRAMLDKGAALLVQVEEAHARAYVGVSALREDPQTRLLRHALLRERVGFELGRSARTGEPLSLLLVDLDGFGAFNRARGYVEGDKVLAKVGRAMGTLWHARPGRRPAVLGREGPDCIAALLPSADLEEAQARAEALRDLVERLPLPPPRLTACVGGVSVAKVGKVDSAELLAAAHQVLARLRAAGPNQAAVDAWEAR